MKREYKKKNNGNMDKALQELLNSTLVKHMSEEQTKQLLLAKESQQDLNALPPILDEYLKNYIIVAHDLLGNEVILSHAISPNDKNAVTKLFHDVFIQMMIKSGPKS